MPWARGDPSGSRAAGTAGVGLASLGLGTVTQAGAVREGDPGACHGAFRGGGGPTDTPVPPQSPGMVRDPSPLPQPLRTGEGSRALRCRRRGGRGAPSCRRMPHGCAWPAGWGRRRASRSLFPQRSCWGGLVAHRHFPPAGSGDSSLEKEFSTAIVGPAVSTPNSQHSSPSRSLSGEYKRPVCPQTCARSGGTEALASSESHSLFSHG